MALFTSHRARYYSSVHEQREPSSCAHLVWFCSAGLDPTRSSPELLGKRWTREEKLHFHWCEVLFRFEPRPWRHAGLLTSDL